MALTYTEFETKTKNTDVGNTFEIVEQNKTFSASCPNLTLKNEWTIEKLNSVKKTKSLSNIALTYHENETNAKKMDVSNTFEIVKHDEKFSASCPNLTLKNEWTIEKLNSVKKIKSLPNMVLAYNDLKIKSLQTSEIVEAKKCAKEKLEVPKKKRQTLYRRFKRFFKRMCCCCVHN